MPCRAGIAWGGPGLNEPLVTGCYGCWLSRTRSCTFVNSSFKRLVSLQGKPFKLSFSIQSASLESRKPSLPARYKRCWFTDVHRISGSEFSASKPYITVDAPDEDFNHFQSPESTPDFIQLSAQKKKTTCTWFKQLSKSSRIASKLAATSRIISPFIGIAFKQGVPQLGSPNQDKPKGEESGNSKTIKSETILFRMFQFFCRRGFNFLTQKSLSEKVTGSYFFGA